MGRKSDIPSRWGKQTEDWEEQERLREDEPDGRESRKKKEEKQSSSLRGKIIKIIVILLVAGIAVFCWLNRENLHPETVLDWIQEKIAGNGIGDGYPAPIVGSVVEKSNFLSSNGEMVMVSDTHLTVMNDSAKELLSRQHSFTNPVLKRSGTRMLIYNLGGKNYQVESYAETLKKDSLQAKIFAGAISSDGTYALLTEEEGYFGMITVYTPENKEQFRYRFSSIYPSAVAVDGTYKKAVVAGVNAKDGALLSSIYVLGLNESAAQEPIAQYEDTLFFDGIICPDGTIVMVGDTRTVVIPAGESPKEYTYSAGCLTSYSLGETMTALCVLPYEGAPGGDLILLDHSGNVSHKIGLQHEMESVSIFGNTAAVLGNGMVEAFSITEGASVGTASSGTDAVAIALRNESSVYILGVSEIRLESLAGS